MSVFLNSGSPRDLPEGATLIASRHHSDPAPTGWLPPEDREPGFSCLGLMGGRWREIWWNPDLFWEAPRFTKRWCQDNPPTAFLPMPAPPIAIDVEKTP